MVDVGWLEIFEDSYSQEMIFRVIFNIFQKILNVLLDLNLQKGPQIQDFDQNIIGGDLTHIQVIHQMHDLSLKCFVVGILAHKLRNLVEILLHDLSICNFQVLSIFL